jgi:hypothetical protein
VDCVLDVIAAVNEPNQDDFKVVSLGLADDARIQSRVTVHDWIVPERWARVWPMPAHLA